MIRHLALSLTLLAATFPSAPAEACSPVDVFWSYHLPQRGGTVPANGTVLVQDASALPPSGSWLAPSGVEVEIETVESPLLPGLGLLEARPVDGWEEGDYADPEWPEEVLFHVSAEDDASPPALELLGWSGENERVLPLPVPCGGGATPAGVRLDLDYGGEDPSALVTGVWFGPVSGRPDRVLFGYDNFLPMEQGEVSDLSLLTVDLAGNETRSAAFEVQACGGCSGSIGGAGAGSPGVALLLLSGLLRRRQRSLPLP